MEVFIMNQIRNVTKEVLEKYFARIHRLYWEGVAEREAEKEWNEFETINKKFKETDNGVPFDEWKP